MKLYLDDERNIPDNTWELVKTADDAIFCLKSGDVDYVSLDHDLGDDEAGTGYKVLLWIENELHNNPTYIPPKISIHTANSSARDKMELGLESIKKYTKLKINSKKT